MRCGPFRCPGYGLSGVSLVSSRFETSLFSAWFFVSHPVCPSFFVFPGLPDHDGGLRHTCMSVFGRSKLLVSILLQPTPFVLLLLLLTPPPPPHQLGFAVHTIRSVVDRQSVSQSVRRLSSIPTSRRYIHTFIQNERPNEQKIHTKKRE